jgi:UDP-glucose 4-epimerase
MHKVLVTGGHGFIAGHVIDCLLAENIEVLAFDHHHDALSKYKDGVDVFLGDVRDANAVTEAVAHADGVIHLAAVLGTAETIFHPLPSAEINILGSLNVFEATNQYNLPVAYAAVGNAWMAPKGAGAYVISKTCAEYFTRMYNKNRGGRIVSLRPMNAYGPRQSVAEPFGSSKVRKIMPSFIMRALCGMPVEVYGSGNQISDMVFVTDVAKVFVAGLKLAASDRPIPEIIEIGPEKSNTVNEVAGMVIDLVTEKTGFRSRLDHIPMRPGEVPDAVVSADVDTLAQVGIDPGSFVGLEDGIDRTIDYFIEHEGITWSRP